MSSRPRKARPPRSRSTNCSSWKNSPKAHTQPSETRSRRSRAFRRRPRAARWLARSLTRPIRDIEDAARRLGQGQLDARAPVPSGPPQLRKLAEELNDAAGRIEQLRATQDAFLADASHQLRTPLAALRLRLENLEAADQTNEDTVAALAEVQRLSRIVDGLLHLARADAEPNAKRVLVEVPQLLEERAEAWKPVAEERGITIVRNTPPGPCVVANPDHLHQVLDNLIANALEVSPAVAGYGSRPLWTTDRYTNKGDASGGFGLGLAIANRLVNVAGGRLDLLQAPTGGVDARIRLQPSTT